MVFHKNIEVRDLKSKYGGTQRGLFALERIEKGELIWYCLCGDEDKTFTRDELLKIIEQHPHLDYFVRSFSYMIDDDLYAMPKTYMNEKNNDECALFNHSCTPNCGFDDTGNGIIAVRTIEPGEELAYHYGFLETETSLIYGLICKCNSSNCDKRLLFDYYRDPQFVDTYYSCMTPYLRKKVHDMKDKWYSTNCYVKRLTPSKEQSSLDSSSSNSDDDCDDNCVQKGLFTISNMKKDDLVASFTSVDNIAENKHYLRHSSQPNCYIKGKDVFVMYDVPSDTELTLYYHGVLL